MKAYAIKNKEGYYLVYVDSDGFGFDRSIICSHIFIKKEGAEETKDFILRNKYKFHIDDLDIVPITIYEGDLEKENEYLKNGIKMCKSVEDFDFVKENFKLTKQLAEKDKEIKQLKLNYEYQKQLRVEQDKEWAEKFEKVCNELERVKKAKNDGLIEVLLKDQRHEICEKIREKAKIRDTRGYETEYWDWSLQDIYDILDQIEKGE